MPMSCITFWPAIAKAVSGSLAEKFNNKLYQKKKGQEAHFIQFFCVIFISDYLTCSLKIVKPGKCALPFQ